MMRLLAAGLLLGLIALPLAAKAEDEADLRATSFFKVCDDASFAEGQCLCFRQAAQPWRPPHRSGAADRDGGRLHARRQGADLGPGRERRLSHRTPPIRASDSDIYAAIAVLAKSHQWLQPRAVVYRYHSIGCIFYPLYGRFLTIRGRNGTQYQEIVDGSSYRELAARTGESLTDAVETAVLEKLNQLRSAERPDTLEAMLARLRPLQEALKAKQIDPNDTRNRRGTLRRTLRRERSSDVIVIDASAVESRPLSSRRRSRYENGDDRRRIDDDHVGRPFSS